MYLLDTNVVSELRKKRPHGGVVSWLSAVADEELYLSAVTLGEIQIGIERTRERHADKALEIEAWADQIASTHRILSVDAPTFRLWAKLMQRQSDHAYEDAMIAATALIHRLTVVTRNVRDFAPFGVATLNPFAESSSGDTAG